MTNKETLKELAAFVARITTRPSMMMAASEVQQLVWYAREYLNWTRPEKDASCSSCVRRMFFALVDYVKAQTEQVIEDVVEDVKDSVEEVGDTLKDVTVELIEETVKEVAPLLRKLKGKK